MTLKKVIPLITAYLLLFVHTAHAQNTGIGTFTAPESIVTNTGDLGPKLFSNIVILLTVISGLWAFIQFILGGFGYITSSGDPKKVTEAQNKIINSLIGMVIVAASFIIAGIVGALFFKNSSFILSPTFKTIN